MTSHHRHFRARIALLALGLLALATPATASATAAPAWRLDLISHPTNFAPGATSTGYTLFVTNVGGEASSGPIAITDTLPPGITPVGADSGCIIAPPTVTCTYSKPIQAGELLPFGIFVEVDPGLEEGSTVEDEASVSGGGASAPASASTTTTISSTPAPFDFIPGESGLGAAALGENGQVDIAAGSHPETVIIDISWPSVLPMSEFLNGVGGGAREVHTYLPRGLVVNPAATPVRCTEAQLEGTGCPDASQIGTVNTIFGLASSPNSSPDALYNMVAPPGSAADLAFNGVGVGIYTHIMGGVRAGDYTIASDTNDIPALFGRPVLGVRLHLWGNPSASSHDHARGKCAYGNAVTCPVAPQDTPLLSMPTACTPTMTIEATTDSWMEPGVLHSRSALLRDNAGNPTGVEDCAALGEGFQPSLEARPTTTSADSPSGVSADLHIPQSSSLSELATAHLRKAVVTLPEGLVLNPSSANGLEGCSSSQVGINPSTGVPNGDQPSCPDASRIGDLEVNSPLIDHALPGSVYAATPYDNPFGSLLAIYAIVDDPKSGVLIKLPAHVEADPRTGRLVTTFDNNPQLPFTDFRLHFFAGAGAVLRTPSVCGQYSTTSEITPWSAPESGPPATPHDDYEISSACSSSESAEPNSPEFGAGTVAPIAGRYTPFLIHLKREDSSQEFSTLTLTPPPGLLGKLAGIPYCPDSALAQAEAKSGKQEKANPSCPAASRIGTVHVAAGAGPAPYWAQGAAYLTGPYKGAPLSMAIITPASAGPYDLGTVVTRVALHVDPETAQITAQSDPIPRILQGIPLDVRQIEVAIDRNEFTRTGTSCDPMKVNASLVSLLGQSAALSSPYQLANCTNLRFKPKLALRLTGNTTRGSHPVIKATLTMPEGSASIAKASVALPHSEFLDQSHIGTVCTRVQYAQNACPAASVYGRATAWSPLLAQPLSGPVYLRSSSHELPDLVASLDGQIHVDLDGRVDSIKGGIRTTFEAIPDAPVSKFVLNMQGGNKGLLQNSTNICKGIHNATASFDAQNGAVADLSPPLADSKCKGRSRHKRHHRRGR